MNNPDDKQKKQAILQRMREKQKPAMPEAAPVQGGGKEKLKAFLKNRAGSAGLSGGGVKRGERMRELLSRGKGESAGSERGEKLRAFLKNRADTLPAGSGQGQRGGKLRDLLRRDGAEGLSPDRKDQLKALLKERAGGGSSGGSLGGKGGKLGQLLQARKGKAGRTRTQVGDDSPEMLEDVKRPGLREFVKKTPPATDGAGSLSKAPPRMAAAQLQQPPKMDFKRAIQSAAELHSSSREEVEARREDLLYRAEWLRAVLAMTEQELELVDQALLGMGGAAPSSSTRG